MEEDIQRMPSGKVHNPLDRAVPGQSLTKPLGQYPWEQPPKETNPTMSLSMILDRFSEGDNLARTLAVLQEGITVKQLARGLILNAFTAGLFNASVAELIKEDLEMFIKIIAEKAGIDYTVGKEKGNAKEFYSSLKDIKDEQALISKNVGTIDVPEPADEAMTDSPDVPDEGLMARPPKEGLMNRGRTV